MGETAGLALHEWESYYVIVGSTAGAHIGLQFVVLTLISEAGMIRGTGDTLSAFGSPNVVHFSAALLVSAVCSAPWHGAGPPAVAVGRVKRAPGRGLLAHGTTTTFRVSARPSASMRAR